MWSPFSRWIDWCKSRDYCMQFRKVIQVLLLGFSIWMYYRSLLFNCLQRDRDKLRPYWSQMLHVPIAEEMEFMSSLLCLQCFRKLGREYYQCSAGVFITLVSAFLLMQPFIEKRRRPTCLRGQLVLYCPPGDNQYLFYYALRISKHNCNVDITSSFYIQI